MAAPDRSDEPLAKKSNARQNRGRNANWNGEHFGCLGCQNTFLSIVWGQRSQARYAPKN